VPSKPGESGNKDKEGRPIGSFYREDKEGEEGKERNSFQELTEGVDSGHRSWYLKAKAKRFENSKSEKQQSNTFNS